MSSQQDALDRSRETNLPVIPVVAQFNGSGVLLAESRRQRVTE
jgi:hypothetical protein